MPWLDEEPTAPAGGRFLDDDKPAGGRWMDDAPAPVEPAGPDGLSTRLTPAQREMMRQPNGGIDDGRAVMTPVRPGEREQDFTPEQQAALAPALSVYETAMKGFTPLFPWPRLDLSKYEELTGEKPSTGLRAAAGVNDVVGNVADAVVSPLGLLTGGAGAAGPGAARAVAGVFAADMARHVPEQAVDVYEAFKLDAPLEQKISSVGNLGVSGAMTGLAGRHAAKGGFEGVTRPVPGDFPALPNPDLVARNVASPGTLRPQEQVLWATPEVEFPIDAVRPELGGAILRAERVPVRNEAGQTVQVREQIVVRLPVRDAKGNVVRMEETVVLPEDPRFAALAERIANPPQLVPGSRGAVRENPAGGKVSFAAEAPVLNREALGPRVERAGLETPPAEVVDAAPVVIERSAPRPGDAPEVTRAEQPSRPGGQQPPVSTTPAEAVKRVARGESAGTRFNRETQVAGTDILDFIRDFGGMLSKSEARSRKGKEWFTANKSLYDDSAALAAPHHNLIYGGRSLPDVIAQAAYDARVLKSPDVAELWAAIRSSSSARAGISKGLAREAKVLNELQAEQTSWLKATAKGEQRIGASELTVGDLMEVDGERVKVTDINPDTGDVTLEDGKKFGTQVLSDGQSIHVEKYQPRTLETDFGPEPSFELNAPESVEQQRVRLAGEEQKRATQAAREKLEREAAAPLQGTAGDLGQGDLLGGPTDLFAPPAPKAKPGLVSGSAAELWADRTIAEGQKRVSAGLDPELLAAYVVKGVAHLERGARSFAAWSTKMLAEHGPAIRPHLRRIFEEANDALRRTTAAVGDDAPNVKMRRLAARASTSDQVPADLQQRLKDSPLSYYEAQRVPDAVDRVGRMTNEELAGVPETSPNSEANVRFLADLELFKRRLAASDAARTAGRAPEAQAFREAAFQGIAELARKGTTFGQLINQLKELNGVAPDNIIAVVNRKLVEAKLPPLRPAEEVVMRTLAEDAIVTGVKARDAVKEWQMMPSDDAAARVIARKGESDQAGAKLNARIHRLAPREFFDLLVTVEQGNVQAPISLAANIAGNLALAPASGPSHAAAVALDMVHSLFRHGKRDLALSPWTGTTARGTGLAGGARQAGEVLRRGVSQSELAADLHANPLRPLQAWRDLLADGKDAPQRQRAALLLEASPQAMAAAAVHRFNAAADVMFRQPKRAALINEALTLRRMQDRSRLKQLERLPQRTLAEKSELQRLRHGERTFDRTRDLALKVPEAVLDGKTMERINEESAAAVFQQKNPLSSWVLARGINRVPSPLGRFALRQLALFVHTPVNLISTLVSYMPVPALINTLRHSVGKNANARLAKQAAGKMIVGGIYSGMAAYLVQQGLIQPSLNSPTDQQKERMQDYFKPGHINLSGLKRVSQGGSGRWQAGDETREVAKLGVPGFLMLQMADFQHAREKAAPETSALEVAANAALRQFTQPGNYAVQQSFLKGTATGLNALLTGDFDRFATGVEGGLVSIVLPNSLTALTRATREIKPDAKGDTHFKTLENILRNRVGGVQRVFGGAGADASLPAARGLFGEPLRETPAGTTPLVYQFFDLTKGQIIPDDPVKAEMFHLYRRTADASVIPEPPDAGLQGPDGHTYRLTREQLGRLSELVGARRRQLAEATVGVPAYLNAPAPVRAGILKGMWNTGASIGTQEFFAERAHELEAKPERRGGKP